IFEVGEKEGQNTEGYREQCDTLRRCRSPDKVSHLDKLSQVRGMGILTPPFFTYIMLILRVEGPAAHVVKKSLLGSCPEGRCGESPWLSTFPEDRLMKYDDIVLGAESAGAIVATRLCDAPHRPVLVIVAAPDYPTLVQLP